MENNANQGQPTNKDFYDGTWHLTIKDQVVEVTEEVYRAYKQPLYHFSNECDMINRIVTGMSAKQFRQAHGLEKGTSIRPYLSDDQIQMIEILQKVDIGLLLAVPDYEQRKRHLEWYKMKHLKKIA